ncbi:MAG TPA: GNAT family protein [Actinocrinis sp.]
MHEQEPDDAAVRLREWNDGDDAAWYAESVRDPLIQRFTTESPTLTADEVRAAIVAMRASDTAEGFVVCDARTGDRLGNIALQHDGGSGEVSYWMAAEARGRGAATQALIMFSAWSIREVGLRTLWLRAHRDNTASQRVALRAGYRRDPDRDASTDVKGEVWPILGFVLDPDRIDP